MQFRNKFKVLLHLDDISYLKCRHEEWIVVLRLSMSQQCCITIKIVNMLRRCDKSSSIEKTWK